MALSLADAGLLTLSFLVPLLLVFLAMPAYIRYLSRSGRVVDDVHKNPVTKVPSPAGPLLFLGALVGELVVYLAFGSLVPVAVIGAAAIAFAIGLTDDLYVLGGLTKPLLLLLAAAPLVILVMVQTTLYEPSLTFPIFGTTSEHFSIYTTLAIVSFPVVANAFNMMDSLNGQVSWFTLLVTSALLFAVVLHASFASGFSLARIAATLPLLAVAAAFLIFNRFPSRVFDGDSGALMFGAMFAALAITGGVELAAMIAIVPAILNSFYILSSVRGLVERRRMKARPTYMGEDGRLYASPDPSAPATFVRMLLLDGPLSERDLVKSIAVLTGIACLLSGVTSLMTWVL
jgi:UDP-N-acetylmuramyl pentapeptide phosphotransferase/UDP-N-acetylglucosamine-1-phosphate transferase